jgi:hypothetical protein
VTNWQLRKLEQSVAILVSGVEVAQISTVE